MALSFMYKLHSASRRRKGHRFVSQYASTLDDSSLPDITQLQAVAQWVEKTFPSDPELGKGRRYAIVSAARNHVDANWYPLAMRQGLLCYVPVKSPFHAMGILAFVTQYDTGLMSFRMTITFRDADDAFHFRLAAPEVI